MGIQLHANGVDLKRAGFKRLDDIIDTYRRWDEEAQDFSDQVEVSSACYRVGGLYVGSYAPNGLVVDHWPNRWIADALREHGCPFELV